MDSKAIYIFTDDENLDVYEGDYVDNYINFNFGGYTLIMSEDNKSIIMNEEGDAFMIMEYV